MKIAFDIIVGVVALYFLKVGKQRTNFPWIFISSSMMFLPMFTATLMQSLLLVGTLSTALYITR